MNLSSACVCSRLLVLGGFLAPLALAETVSAQSVAVLGIYEMVSAYDVDFFSRNSNSPGTISITEILGLTGSVDVLVNSPGGAWSTGMLNAGTYQVVRTADSSLILGATGGQQTLNASAQSNSSTATGLQDAYFAVTGTYSLAVLAIVDPAFQVALSLSEAKNYTIQFGEGMAEIPEPSACAAILGAAAFALVMFHRKRLNA